MSNLEQQIQRFGQNEERVDLFANGSSSEKVTTRYGTQYPTLANAVAQVIASGGYVPYTNTDALLNSIPNTPVQAGVAMDTGKVYLWSNGIWEDSHQSATDKFMRLWNEVSGLKGAFNALIDGNSYELNNRGRYFRDGRTDLETAGYDIYSSAFVNSGLIFLPAGATATTSVQQDNVNNTANVANFLVFDKQMRFKQDLTLPNTIEVMETVDYIYTAPEDCYIAVTSIKRPEWDANKKFQVNITGDTSNPWNTVKKAFENKDKTLARLIVNLRASVASLTSPHGKPQYGFNEFGRFSSNGQFDLNWTGDIYTAVYRNTGLIRLEIGDRVVANLLQPDSNVQAFTVFDLEFNLKEEHKRADVVEGRETEYEYTATETCYIVFTSINPSNRAESVGNLKAIVYPPTNQWGTNYLQPENDVMLRASNTDLIVSSKLGEEIPFLAPGTGYKADGAILEGEYALYYKSTGKVPVLPGDTIEALIDTYETGGIMSALNIYDAHGVFIRCVHSIPDFGSQGIAAADIKYTCNHKGFVTVTSIHRGGDREHLSNPYVFKNRTSNLSKSVRNNNSKMPLDTLFTLPKPTSIIQLDMYAVQVFPPESKAQGSFRGRVVIRVDGVEIESFAEYGVQGSSSAAYPKKNWSFGFFADENFEVERKIKLGNFIPQQELVWKANYIDATHSRNVLCNRLWEEMVQTRGTFPLREVDRAYINQPGVKSLDTGATGHVDGFPCVVNLNGKFYGLGTLNIGKKRDNYNLNKDDKKQVQFELLGGGVDFAASTPPYSKLGLRNPKLSGYKEGDTITDPTVVNSMQALWNFHRLPLEERRAQFDTYYDRVNVVDWYMLVEFTAAADLLDKNSILTTWDGTKYCWMPYDLDTTFGIHWAGTGLGYDSNWNWDANNIIPIVRPIILEDVIKRYKQLRDNGVFSLLSVYKINRDIESKFTQELFKMEQAKWPNIPSKDFGGIQQIMEWLTKRLNHLDAKYGYKAEKTFAQKLWSPPTLGAGASQTTTLAVAEAKTTDKYTVDFSTCVMSGTTVKAECLADGVITVTHTNPTENSVNIDEIAVTVTKL